jgi:hypothetical protein
MARGAEWYLRVDNLTNIQRNERDISADHAGADDDVRAAGDSVN